METTTLHAHQEILEQFKLRQIEIEASRFLSEKSECTIIIENKQHFVEWSELLEKTVIAIQQSSSALEAVVDQGKNHEDLLDRLDTALDDLIHLQSEITVSCSHNTDLMEGRYLMDHAVGYYLDQISLHINEYRYLLNQRLFNCHEDTTEKWLALTLPLPIMFKKEVEITAFNCWLSKYEDP